MCTFKTNLVDMQPHPLHISVLGLGGGPVGIKQLPLIRIALLVRIDLLLIAFGRGGKDKELLQLEEIHRVFGDLAGRDGGSVREIEISFLECLLNSPQFYERNSKFPATFLVEKLPVRHESSHNKKTEKRQGRHGSKK